MEDCPKFEFHHPQRDDPYVLSENNAELNRTAYFNSLCYSFPIYFTYLYLSLLIFTYLYLSLLVPKHLFKISMNLVPSCSTRKWEQGTHFDVCVCTSSNHLCFKSRFGGAAGAAGAASGGTTPDTMASLGCGDMWSNYCVRDL